MSQKQSGKEGDALAKANYALNYQAIQMAVGVETLKGKLAGASVAVAGAGPSLDGNLGELRDFARAGGAVEMEMSSWRHEARPQEARK